MAIDNLRLIKEFIEAANSQDYDKVASFFADDSEYEDVPSGAVWHGAKEFTEYARSQVHIEFPDHKWELKSCFR